MISYLRIIIIIVILLILVLNVFLSTRLLSKSHPLSTNEKTISMFSNIAGIILFLLLAYDIYRSSIPKKGSIRDQMNNLSSLNNEIEKLRIQNRNLITMNNDLHQRLEKLLYNKPIKYTNLE